MESIINGSAFVGITRVVAFAGVMILGGCGETLPNTDEADSEIAATWYGGIHTLPSSMTRSGRTTDISFQKNERDEWEQRIQEEILKPGVRVPAVIYLHGSSGPYNARRWANDFATFGYAQFAPNSFKRPGRVGLAGTGQMHWRMILRKQELRYALAQIRSISWIDSERLILAGFSEGAQAAANYSGDGFMAVILFGTDCRFGGPNSPAGVPVLNIVGANDHYGYGGGCSFWRTVGGSKSVTLSGVGHNVQGNVGAQLAIAEFLETCCGYVPEDETAGLIAQETAEILASELGDLAAMVDAQLRAASAKSLGNEKGYEFWMEVYEIVFRSYSQ
jgi:dienelactone hydrolase